MDIKTIPLQSHYVSLAALTLGSIICINVCKCMHYDLIAPLKFIDFILWYLTVITLSKIL